MVLTIAGLAITLITGTVYASALTQEQINAIVNLLQSFGAEQSVISNVQISLSGGTPSVSDTSTIPSTPPVSECYRLSSGMWVGLSDREAGNEVSQLQKFLRAQGDFTYSEITGFYGPATEEAVRRFQSRSGIVSGGNAETTGYGVVGPSTRAKIIEVSCGIISPSPRPDPISFPIPPSNNLPPVIDGVSGPTTLGIGETGTWSMKAHDPENGNLSYIVNWGDGINSGGKDEASALRLSAALQTTTFTHSYSTAGTYKVGFTVIDSSGLSAQSSISVQVGNVSSVPVKIVDDTTYGTVGDAFVRLSILGTAMNKQVHHWVLGYNCLVGVTLDTGSDFGKPLLCDGKGAGKSFQTYYAYNIADVTKDYLMITAGAKNNTSATAQIVFVLEARDASDKTLGSDTKTITLGSVSQPSIIVTSPVTSGSTANFTVSSPSGFLGYKLKLTCDSGLEGHGQLKGGLECNEEAGFQFSNTPWQTSVVPIQFINNTAGSLGAKLAVTFYRGQNFSGAIETVSSELVKVLPLSASPSVTAYLLNTSDDRAGAWHNFGPGAGNINKNPADWNWNLNLTFNSQGKEVKRMTVIHNTKGEVWSTGYSRYLADGTDLYGYEEHPYPLVVMIEKVGPGSGVWNQINNSYDQKLFIGGPTASLGVVNTYRLHGQRENSAFTGGKLVVEFSDGTSVTSIIPAGGIVPQPSITVLSPNGGETFPIYNVPGSFDVAWQTNYAWSSPYLYVDNSSGTRVYSKALSPIVTTGRQATFLSNTVFPVVGTYKIVICSSIDDATHDPICGTSDSYFTITAPMVEPTSVSFEAESGTLVSPFTSANGYISQAIETGLDATSGRATYRFTLPANGTYVVKGLVSAGQEGWNSFFIAIDAEPTNPASVWHIPVTSGFEWRTASWQGAGAWNNSEFVPKYFNLTNGEHTLNIRGREANTLLDKITIEPITSTASLTPEAVSAIAAFSQQKNLNLASILSAIEKLIEAFR